MARPSYRLELAIWTVLPVMMGAVEGGVIGTIATRAFVDVASSSAIELSVGIIMGAGASTNLSSAIWAALARGRNKTRLLAALIVAMVVCAAAVAATPISSGGLVFLTTMVVLARVFWCGVVTIRTSVWGANWSRETRARITGRIMIVSALVAAGVGLAFGALLDHDPSAFRWLCPTAAVTGLIAAALYGRIRVRRDKQLRTAERESGTGSVRVLGSLRPLVANRPFRRFMACLFVLGSGNMMVDAPLVLAMKDAFHADYLVSIAVVSSIPVFTMPFAVGLWSRLLDRVHVVQFRAVHSWAFVLSNVLLLTGMAMGSLWIVVIAAIGRGVGFAGGVLAWNLGHHDYAPPGEAGTYMATHVTLTGIRGLIAPLAGVALWSWVGWWAFAVPLALSLAGAIGFGTIAKAAKTDATRA